MPLRWRVRELVPLVSSIVLAVLYVVEMLGVYDVGQHIPSSIREPAMVEPATIIISLAILLFVISATLVWRRIQNELELGE